MAAKQPDPSGIDTSKPCETKNDADATGHVGQTQYPVSRVNPNISLKSTNPAKPRILVIHDDDVISKALELILCHAGFASARVKSMEAGCELAKSGRFQVIVTKPTLVDGSWKLLMDIDSQYRPGFVIILVASAFDHNECGQALEDGAFDVLAGLHEMSWVAEVARRAFWAAYLKGAGPRPEVWSPRA